MRVTEAQSYTEPRDSISHDWLVRLGEWGLMPQALFNIQANINSLLKNMSPDLLILTGGDDIGAYPLRDKMETGYLQAAIELDIPVLGVCRGMQIINKYYGGKLSSLHNHVNTDHDVFVNQHWQDIYPSCTPVNSYHTQGISRHDLAVNLLPMATDKDQFVESLIHPDFQIAAVMWHPERAGAPPQDCQLLNKLISGNLHSYD